jgi:hypothetical protein
VSKICGAILARLPTPVSRLIPSRIWPEIRYRTAEKDQFGDPKVSEWQPISTAPKDGSEILVCRAGAEDIFEFIAWNPILRAWLDRNAEPHEGATHWLPIPPTPKH